MKKILSYFNLFMIAFYVFCALSLLLNDTVLTWLIYPNRAIIASTLLLYSAFKGYRFYKERQSVTQDEQV